MIQMIDRDGQPLPTTLAAAALRDDVSTAGQTGPLDSLDDPFGGDPVASPFGEDEMGIVDKPVASNVAGTDIGVDIGDDDEYQLREPIGGGVSSASSVGELRTRPPRARKKTSVLKSILGVAAGPPLALVLGYFILSAVGSVPDLGFWPFIADQSDRRTTRVAGPPVERRETENTAAENDRLVNDHVGNDHVGNDRVVNDRSRESAPQPRPAPIELKMPSDDDQDSQPSGVVFESTDPAPDVATKPQTNVESIVEIVPPESPTLDAISPPPNPQSLEALVEKTQSMIIALQDVPPKDLQKPTLAAFRSLCDIAGQSPKPSESIKSLTETISSSPHRNKFRGVAPLLMDSILRNGNGMFFIGQLSQQRELVIAKGPTLTLTTQNDSNLPTGLVMVFGQVELNAEPQIIRASIVESVEP